MSKQKKAARTPRLNKKAKPRRGTTIATVEGGLPEAAEEFIEQTASTHSKQRTPKQPREDLMVFAFRLTKEESRLIHKAAGPGKASKFARELLVAAARNDEAGIKTILKSAQRES